MGGMLAASGTIGLYFSWSEIRSNLHALQVEKAQGAANRIEQYLLDIEREMFLSLCGEQKTLERIQYMLENGKPLRN